MTRNQLIEENMNLVHYTIKRYYPQHIHDEDIIQVGMVGLCKAADKWDAEKGAFSTFAVQRIRSEISYEFRKQRKRLKTLSLEGLYGECDEDSELKDFIVGDQDVNYVDLPALYKKLSPLQQKIFDLKREGFENIEIARELNLSREYIRQQVRVIQLKWIKYIGKG